MTIRVNPWLKPHPRKILILSKTAPTEGYRLTNGEVIAGGTVYLGKLDSPDNWREITSAEAAALEAQREKETE